MNEKVITLEKCQHNVIKVRYMLHYQIEQKFNFSYFLKFMSILCF